MDDLPARQATDELEVTSGGRVDLGFERSDIEALLLVRMPFGRYRGQVLIDLPEEYLLWFERDTFPSGRLGQLMQLALGIKRYGAESVVKNLRRLSIQSEEQEQAGPE